MRPKTPKKRNVFWWILSYMYPLWFFILFFSFSFRRLNMWSSGSGKAIPIILLRKNLFRTMFDFLFNLNYSTLKWRTSNSLAQILTNVKFIIDIENFENNKQNVPKYRETVANRNFIKDLLMTVYRVPFLKTKLTLSNRTAMSRNLLYFHKN